MADRRIEIFPFEVRMHNISNEDNYNDTFLVQGRTMIADLMTMALDSYNASRNSAASLHPDSPFILSADGSRHPREGSIVAVMQTCGALQEYVRREKPKSLSVRVHARLIAEEKK